MARDKDTRHDDEPVRQGDILGLGGAAVPKSPEDRSASLERDVTHDTESIRGDADERGRDTAYRRSPGATGIDMGAGGEGTDVE
jgi:hypothetical protein